MKNEDDSAVERLTADYVAERLLRSANLIDDEIFEAAAKKKGFMEELLRCALQDPKLTVEWTKTQYRFKTKDRRGLVFDSVCCLSDGTRANVEVQTTETDDLLRRARLHGAALTTASTPPNARFSEVPNVCIVFLCQKASFNEGHAYRRAHMTFSDNGAPLDDGYSEIFLAPSKRDDSIYAELMRLFTANEYYSERFPVISEVKRFYLNDDEGKREMGSLVKEYIESRLSQERQEGIQQGIQQGRQEGRQEGRREGRQEGRQEGEERERTILLTLIRKLIDANRFDDIRRLSIDSSYRETLIREFKIGEND